MFRVLSNYYKWVTYNFRCRLSSSVTSLSFNPDDDWVSLEIIQVNKNSHYTEQQLKHSMTTGIGCENVYFFAIFSSVPVYPNVLQSLGSLR